MAVCRIVNQGVLSALDSIESCRSSYEKAGQTLISSLTSAISDMEGAAKDAFQDLINNKIKEFVETSLPEAIKGMHTLLEENRKNFEEVDQKIADNISGG